MLDIDHLGTMLMVNPVIIYSRPLRSTDADSATPVKKAARFTGHACGGKYTNRFAMISALLPGQVAQAKTLNCLRIVRVCLRQNILL
jgi:hypothetical protein